MAMEIAEHLHFHVARAIEIAFEIDITVAERAHRFSLGERHQSDEIGLVVGDAHAATAATSRRLDHDRIPDALRLGRASPKV
ncbi:MAG: hypothetical protein R2843_15235 [Thermomicrobiales bacterium]